jgi:putative nucleotidyltransferase with HDIG domain
MLPRLRDPEMRRLFCFGGPGEIRTHDLFHAMEARSQLRHRPTRGDDFHNITRSGNIVEMDREQAWELLCEFTKSDSLRRHALAVEACVAAYAAKFGADERKWSVTALLHDFDYEMHPNAPDHPMKGEPILAERGLDEEIRRAILSHANYSGVSRDSALEKTLFACDELAGFLTACSYVKPNRSIFEVDTKSVRKKLKDKGFARSVSRDDITNGAQELGVDLDQHIEFCIEAMKRRAAELGIAGN